MTLSDKILSLKREHKTDNEILQLIEEYLSNKETSTEEYIDAVQNYWFGKYLNVELLAQCIDKICSSKSIDTCLLFIDKYLEYHYDKISTKEMSNLVFELIIDLNGYKRFIGRHMWDSLNIDNTDFDVLSFPEEFQARFALSILQDLGNPEKRLRNAIALFNSDSQVVRSFILNSLSEYAIHYLGTVTRRFKNSIINPSNQSIDFNTFLENMDKRLELSHKCKELLPEYSMPTTFELCNQTVRQHLHESLKESEKKNDDSIFKLFNKVLLAKGGGWRNDDGSVQPLGHFRFSHELPGMIYAMSPLENIEFSNKLLLDWNTIIKRVNDEKQDN